jgi:hypothetical protein
MNCLFDTSYTVCHPSSTAFECTTITGDRLSNHTTMEFTARGETFGVSSGRLEQLQAAELEHGWRKR